MLYLRISDIGDDGRAHLTSPKYVSHDVADIDKYGLEFGDVVIARSGTVGRSFVYKGSDKPWVFASYMIRFRPDKKAIVPDYLKFYMQSPYYWHHIQSLSRVVAQPNINSRELSSLEIPLPPIQEQQRIVDILRQADELRQLREQANKKAEELLPAIFLDMFGDPVVNPKGWNKKLFGKVGELDRGKSKHRPRDAAHLYGGHYPFIQTGDVANSNGWITEYTQTYSEAGLEQSRLWPKGTLCITIAANIAKSAILTFEACFPDSIVGFTPSQDVTTEYVREWLNQIQGRLEAAAPQAAQKNINLGILRELEIPCPPKTLQEKFTEIVDECRHISVRQSNSSTSHLTLAKHASKV